MILDPQFKVWQSIFKLTNKNLNLSLRKKAWVSLELLSFVLCLRDQKMEFINKSLVKDLCAVLKDTKNAEKDINESILCVFASLSRNSIDLFTNMF
jgi:hypothetical protein